MNRMARIVLDLNRTYAGTRTAVQLCGSQYDIISHDLYVLGYTADAYDMCVFNRTENNKSQTTLIIHVDDMMISYCSDRYVDMVTDTISWTNKTYRKSF